MSLLLQPQSILGFITKLNYLSASVVSGLRVRLEIQGSRVQTRLRSMIFFQDVKILSTSPPGGTLSWRFRV